MTNCAFTIVAKNYIGLGHILGQSLLRQQKDIDFFIFVVDEFQSIPETLPPNIVFVKNIAGYSHSEWVDMAFKYDLTEFCTAVKPACFQHIFSLGYEKAIYFDPDIYIFSSIDEILSKLQKYSIVLTPQIAAIHVNYEGEHPEWAMNVNGIFNLGFCGMRKSQTSEQILQWWRIRLKDNCFVDRSTGNFTDQKWMDWIPGFFANDELFVFHHIGMNMAPWNFFERELFLKDNQIWVRPRNKQATIKTSPLVFLHFAGYDYNQLKQGKIVRKRIENLSEYEDLALATTRYKDAFLKNAHLFDAYLPLQYSYATYDNAKRIDSFHRRLYHGLILAGEEIKAPFSTGHKSFYDSLLKKKMIQAENLDQLTQRNISNIDKKREQIAILFKMLYWVLGYKRYSLFVKSLYNYCRPEMHTFLVKKKNINKPED